VTLSDLELWNNWVYMQRDLVLKYMKEATDQNPLQLQWMQFVMVPFYPQDLSTFYLTIFLAAKSKNIDCVLIDTAGRMQDNEPLMKALSKVSSIEFIVVLLVLTPVLVMIENSL